MTRYGYFDERKNRHPCQSSVKKKAQESWSRSGERALLLIRPSIYARVPLGCGLCSRRTGHPFAASSSEELSQKIEFVSSASPETMRSEPQEFPPFPWRFAAGPGSLRIE